MLTLEFHCYFIWFSYGLNVTPKGSCAGSLLPRSVNKVHENKPQCFYEPAFPTGWHSAAAFIAFLVTLCEDTQQTRTSKVTRTMG